MHCDQLCCKWRADHSGQRLCEIEQCQDLVAVTRRHPGRQEQNCTWEEASFSNTQQEAQDVELGCAGNPSEQKGDDAPCHHDTGEPFACAKFVQREIARHFKNDIADKEDTGGKTELSCCQRKVGSHPVRTSKGNCGAIQEVDEEHQRDEGNQPDRNFRYG